MQPPRPWCTYQSENLPRRRFDIHVLDSNAWTHVYHMRIFVWKEERKWLDEMNQRYQWLYLITLGESDEFITWHSLHVHVLFRNKKMHIKICASGAQTFQTTLSQDEDDHALLLLPWKIPSSSHPCFGDPLSCLDHDWAGKGPPHTANAYLCRLSWSILYLPWWWLSPSEY